MSVDLTKLTEEVSQIETVAASVEKVVGTIADEVRALRNEGGGALQSQLDKLAARLDAVKGALGQAVQSGTAADAETPAPPTSAEIQAEQAGAAGQAADALKAQDEAVPQ